LTLLASGVRRDSEGASPTTAVINQRYQVKVGRSLMGISALWRDVVYIVLYYTLSLGRSSSLKFHLDCETDVG
jgi:hypothetical protein